MENSLLSFKKEQYRSGSTGTAICAAGGGGGRASSSADATRHHIQAVRSTSLGAPSGINQLPSTRPPIREIEPQPQPSGSTWTAGGATGGVGGRGTTSADATSNPAAEHQAAGQQRMLSCTHELLSRVWDALKGNCDVETSELVTALKRIGFAHPKLAEEANKLAEDVMESEAPTHGDTTRKDLVKVLTMLLDGVTDVKGKHRKIKTFVFGLHKRMLEQLRISTGRSRGESLKLSVEQQQELLRQALASGGAGDDREGDSGSAMPAFQSASSRIVSTPVTRGANEVITDKARKLLSKAR